MRLLLVDNYDSFTYNLFQLLAQTSRSSPTVLVNDDRRLGSLDPGEYDAVVISPGPGRPQRATDVALVNELLARHPQLPVLGVCLGHQAIAHVSGAQVREGRPRHGYVTRVTHDGLGPFAGLPQHFRAVRYHSLHVTELPETLVATAWAEDDSATVMGLQHRQLPRWGVQFHPESVATEYGADLVRNFLRLVCDRTGCSLGAPAARTPAVAVPSPPGTGPASVAAPARPMRLVVELLSYEVDTARVFAKLYADRPRAFWLDSSRTHAGQARFSFLGDDSGPLGETLTYRVGSGHVVVRRGEVVTTEPGSVFEVLERRLAQRAVPRGDLPFDLDGGYVGYFGYELKAETGGSAAHRSTTPDAVWIFADRLVVVDHLEQATYVVAVTLDRAPDVAAAQRWARETADRLGAFAGWEQAGRTDPEPRGHRAGAVDEKRLARDRDRYLRDIRACQEELHRGESYEICLTNQFRFPALSDPFAYYLRLRRANPAPYAAYLAVDGVTVMSSSPERFVRITTDRVVESKPIKGTAPRAADPDVDEALRLRLASSAKDRAENLMIVDLLRNDLGRVCEVGSVHVPHFLATETYATVHQLVSTVRGTLRASVGPVACVRACFPGGSMTGAPKRRTMAIIDRLEGAPRGIYSGALGYFGLSGGADLSIVIRTAVDDGTHLTIGAGGAIVVDSDAEDEFAEMALKARALVRARSSG